MMLKHCRHNVSASQSPAASPSHQPNSSRIASHSLSSLECSTHSSGSEVSFDASFGSASTASSCGQPSPLPTVCSAASNSASYPVEVTRSVGGTEVRVPGTGLSVIMSPLQHHGHDRSRGSLNSGGSEPRLSSAAASPAVSLSSSTTAAGPKVSIKVYASCLRPDIEYKTLCVSTDTRSREVIWQLLSKFKMKHRDPKLFYLTMDIVIASRTGDGSAAAGVVSRTMVLDEDARPAELATCNPWGECRFTLQMKKGGLVRIHDSVLMTASQYKSLLISEETTVEDVVRILLHCYGLDGDDRRFPVDRFCLYEHCKTQSYERKLNYADRPLAVQDSWLDPDQFRLVLRRTPPGIGNGYRGVGSIHQLGLPNVPVHSAAMSDMGARALQASLVEKYSRFCQRYESYFYV